MAVNSPPVSVGSDLVSPLSLPPDLRQQISGSTAATQAITAPVPPTNSLDNAKPGDTVTLTPEQQAEFDKSAGIVNPIRDLSAEQIAELAKTNPEFSIVNEYATQPDLSSDPAIADKVAHAWNLYKQTPFKLPAISDVAKNIWGFAKSAAQRGAIAGRTILPADLGGYETPEALRQAQGEAIGGSELGVSGLVNFAKHIGQSAARGMRLSTPLKDQSNSEQLEAFGQALAENHAQQSILAGKGPLLGTAAGQAAQANAEPLRPQKISELAASDPFSFAAASGAFGLAGKAAGLGGKVISAITPEAISAPVSALVSKLPTAGQAAATVVGRGLEKTADLTQMGTTLAAKITPAVGAIIGGLKAENFGHTGIGIFGGYKAGQIVANSLGKLGGLMEPVAKAGREIAGVEPVTSNIAQLGKDIVTATPSALGALGKGYAFDAGLSAMAETPEEARGSVGFGTAFGALGGAEGIARHAISGQIIAPRAWGSNFPVASSGQFPALEAMHNEAYSAAEPGVKARLNAIRSFTQGLPNAADVFYGKDSGAVAKALTDMGMTPEAAAAFGDQKGFFTTDLPGKDGTNKRVIVVRDVAAAPHEAIHALDDVLGEDANRKFDDFIKQEYGADWENIGQDYAERLTGGKIPEGQTWRDAVLNSSRWGVAEAGDKLYSQTAEKLKAQTGAEPTPDEIKTASKQDWNARLTAASGDENAVVRGILTPEELSATADRYIAREIKAEAGDALIKSGGTGFKGPQGILPKLARTVGNVISLFGGEPLAGRTSEVGKIPLKADVINRLSSEAQGIIPEPKKAERPTIVPATPAGRGIPATPEAAAAAGTEAKDIAAAAPAEIPVGGTKSPRELLGAIAEAIAQRAGVKINYLSAPDEPAAATTSNRPLRRQMIELYRSMPDAARGLWEKSFFPERVLKNKSGYQVLGWSPEVFAANAHKMGGALLKLPGGESLSPYQLDPKTGSFTEQGWRDLYTDVTQFVKNQQAGRTGAGEPMIVPKVTAEKGFNAPQILGGESPLDQRKADFVSMLYNFKLPETPRITGGKLPLNIAGQEISAATKPGRVEIPVRPRGNFEGEPAQKLGIEGKPILEVNPVRNEIERASQAAGQPMPSLIEAIQRLDLNHIKEVAVAPELPQFRGNSLTLTAGFQPESVHDSMEKMKGFSPEEFNGLKSFNGKHGGGITGWAFDVGSQVKSEADIAALRSARDTMRDMGKEAMKNKDFDLAANYFTRSQAAREAFEFATGKQIDDETKTSGSADMVRKRDPNYVPPAEQFKTQAQPKEANDVEKLAGDYAKSAGINYAPPSGKVTYNRELAKRIAAHYDAAEHDPADPAVKASYDAFIQETLNQFKAIQAAGYNLEPISSAESPYRSGADAQRDVEQNKHLSFNTSDAAFGQPGQNLENQRMLEPSGIKIGDKELSVNDAFRAVHDFFGHAKQGHSFGPEGEFNAWREHSALYSPEAQGALGAETIGQTAWTQLGPHLLNKAGELLRPGEPGFTPRPERPYAEQKNLVLPPNLISEAKSQPVKGAAQAQFQPRELATPDAEKRFAGSKVRFEDGTLKPVFHGTVNSFDPTEIDTRGFSAHFGSPDAAATRIIGGPGEKSQSALTANEGHKLMPTFLDMRKPLRLRDASNWDDARSVAEEINRKLGPEALRRAGLPPINAIDGAIEGRANDLMDTSISDRRSAAAGLPRSMQSIDPINHPPEYAIANYEILDKLKQYLKSRGYDGIVYENAFENEPPMIRRNVTYEPLSYTGQRDYNADSYIPFDSDQVHSAIPPKIGGQFSPSKAPKAIRAAALKSDDGRIFEGYNHPDAYEKMLPGYLRDHEFVEGFTDNQGKFLTREEAYERAVKHKQFDESKDYNDDYIAPGELAAESLKNRGAQFQPSDHPDAIKAAAVRDKDGVIYSGAHHLEAYQNATKAGVPLENFDEMGVGFVTNSGEYLNREQAFQRAKKLKQFRGPEFVPGELASENLKPQAQFSPKESNDKWKLARAGGGGFSKAWILPNGEPVQLGGQWHHEWINEHPEEQKRWGLPAGQEGEENRISALKKGFARVNYDNRSGHLTVEAKSSAWRKLNPSVEKLVEANLGSIDRMTVHLMSDSIKKVNDSETVSLFDKGAEKMKHIPFITGSEPNAQFQPASFDHPDFEKEIDKIRSGQSGGQTFTPSGAVWQPKTPTDIVSLASVNLPQGELTPEAFHDAVAPYSDLLAHPNVAAGVYSFSKDGKPTVSVDINALVPKKHRENTLAFAKDNDQRDIFDTEKMDSIPAGGKGDTRLTKPEEMLDALDGLTSGKPVSVEKIKRKYRGNLADLIKPRPIVNSR
jgi:hypothetical protein